MVVYDSGVKAAGIAEKILEQIEKADVKVTVFDGVIPNPTNEAVEEAAMLARENEIDVFVAVGGGSSIDLTKAVNILMTNRTIWWNGIGKESGFTIDCNSNNSWNFK